MSSVNKTKSAYQNQLGIIQTKFQFPYFINISLQKLPKNSRYQKTELLWSNHEITTRLNLDVNARLPTQIGFSLIQYDVSEKVHTVV